MPRPIAPRGGGRGGFDDLSEKADIRVSRLGVILSFIHSINHADHERGKKENQPAEVSPPRACGGQEE